MLPTGNMDIPSELDLISQDKSNSEFAVESNAMLNLSHKSGTVHLDFDNLTETVLFKYSNGSLVPKPSINVSLIGGPSYYKYLKVPARVIQINSTNWNITFLPKDRRGYGSGNYTLKITGLNYDMEIASVKYYLQVNYNNDTTKPKIEISSNDFTNRFNGSKGTLPSVLDFSSNPRLQTNFNIIVTDNRFPRSLYIYFLTNDSSYNMTFLTGGDNLGENQPFYLNSNKYRVLMNRTTIQYVGYNISFAKLFRFVGSGLLLLRAFDIENNMQELIVPVKIILDRLSPMVIIKPNHKTLDYTNITLNWKANDSNPPDNGFIYNISLDFSGDMVADEILKTGYNKTYIQVTWNKTWISNLSYSERTKEQKKLTFFIETRDRAGNLGYNFTEITINISTLLFTNAGIIPDNGYYQRRPFYEELIFLLFPPPPAVLSIFIFGGIIIGVMTHIFRVRKRIKLRSNKLYPPSKLEP